MKKKYLFCFDIDGTLLSTKGAGSRSFKKAIFEIFKKNPEWENISLAGRIDPSIFKEIVKNMGWNYSFDLWQRFKVLYLRNLKNEVENANNWIIFEGVEKVLEKLNSLNCKSILLTGNIKEGAFLKLKAVGLDNFFDWKNSVFGEDGENRREELAVAFKNKLGNSLKPIVIGDTPYDIRVGKLINAITIAVATGFFSWEILKKNNPDFLLSNLGEFPFEYL